MDYIKKFLASRRVKALIILFCIIAVLVLYSHWQQSKNSLPSDISTSDINPTHNTIKSNQNLYKTFEQRQLEEKRLHGDSYINNQTQSIHQNNIQSETTHIKTDHNDINNGENHQINRTYNDTSNTNYQEISNNTQRDLDNFQQLLKKWGDKSEAATVNVETNNSNSDQNSTNTLNNSIVNIKAGKILFAAIETSVNSDQPSTPVLATIAVGKYKGSKLLGAFTRENDGLVIKFTTLSIPNIDRSIPINAYAINSNTAQTSLSSNVDHHYLMRYGSAFAAAFLEGFGQYFSNNQPNQKNICISTSDHPCNVANQSVKNGLYSGLGQSGAVLSSSLKNNMNTPPTVTLKSGTGVGILFMQDVTTQNNN